MTVDSQIAALDSTVMDAALGRTAVPGRLEPSQALWGFGGLHGGLTLALLVRALQQEAGPLRLASVSATFVKPLRGSFDISHRKVHGGRTAEFWGASASVNGAVVVNADAVMSASDANREAIAPEKPHAPPPLECVVFRPPSLAVPFSGRTEIRPVGTNRPFGGGVEAELTAWLRLTDDEEPPDVPRLVILMDALAPSYSAILDAPAPIPTVVLTMSPVSSPEKGDSPWVLLRARTVASSADGWIDEHLDAWSPGGLYLGHAYQRRLLVSRDAAATAGRP